MLNLSQLTANASAPSQNISNLTRLNSSAKNTGKPDATKEAFQQFVGETFFQMMLKSMRSMHDKPAYMHGGQAEDMFQGQLDQQIAGDLAHNSGGSFSEDLYQLFDLQQKHPLPQTN